MKTAKMLIAAAIWVASMSVHAGWMCQVVNYNKNQVWNGTGPSRAIALENAMMFCSNHSQFVRNCLPTHCSQN